MDFKTADQNVKNLQYITSMRPVFNKLGLFSDMTDDYVIPSQPAPYSHVKIRFRSAKNNIDYVFLVFCVQSY